MSEWKDTNKKSITESLIEVSKKIEAETHKGKITNGIIATTNYPETKKLLESWGYEEVSPNYWERKK